LSFCGLERLIFSFLTLVFHPVHFGSWWINLSWAPFQGFRIFAQGCYRCRWGFASIWRSPNFLIFLALLFRVWELRKFAKLPEISIFLA
jgi:hypothetical protein